MLKANKKRNSFSTVELLISISIMFVLGSVFLLNYNAQKDEVELNNALSITSQEIRKAQALVLAQTALPAECGTTGSRDAFGVLFDTDKNYVTLYVDKNSDGIPNMISDSCSCADTGECIEQKYFSPSIKLNAIIQERQDGVGNISFSSSDLSVNINNDNSQSTLQLDFCPNSNCDANTKSILMNNKGMVDIQ